MGMLHIKFRSAKREPLNDRLHVQVLSVRNNVVLASQRDVPGARTLKVDNLAEGQPYVVRAFPVRHRPVAVIATVPVGRPGVAELFFPLHPDRVDGVRFPDYATLPPELTRVLDASSIEGATTTGAALYGALTDTERAGLLNLFAKMNSFGFDGDRSVWDSVARIYRVRPDRIFVDVEVGLRDKVKSTIAENRFREVSGKLHTPPPGFVACGSFKTDDRYGNLQLSFFSSVSSPLSFKVDADIDDAAGIGHAFQVLRNWVTDGNTHPYDIHEILVFRQDVQLPYQLV